MRAFRSRELDACILRVPVAGPASSHASIRLLRDPLVVAMHCGHPLRTKAKLLLADLEKEAFVSFPRSSGSGLFEILLQLCAERSFHPRIVQETADITTVLALAAAKLGLAVVPSSMARIDVAGIVIVPLSDADATTEVHVAFPEVDPSPLVASLCSIAQAAVRQFETSPARADRCLRREHRNPSGPMAAFTTADYEGSSAGR
jgi:DNA-binding transcriptional LysR family regulator